MTDCYATGTVSGADSVGGLVGYSANAEINKSYAAGKVIGARFVGGLAGSGRYVAINKSYASGSVEGSYSGGGGWWDIASLLQSTNLMLQDL